MTSLWPVNWLILHCFLIVVPCVGINVSILQVKAACLSLKCGGWLKRLEIQILLHWYLPRWIHFGIGEVIENFLLLLQVLFKGLGSTKRKLVNVHFDCPLSCSYRPIRRSAFRRRFQIFIRSLFGTNDEGLSKSPFDYMALHCCFEL